MASFRIHEDQENLGRETRHTKGGNGLGQQPQRRPVLGAIDSNRQGFKGKQPLVAGNNKKVLQSKAENVQKQAPVPPVAQFQKFNVYEDTAKEETKDKDELARKKEILELYVDRKAVADETPMSVEKKSPKSDLENSERAAIQCNATRNKDLFFELEEYRETIYEHLLRQEKIHRPKSNYMKKQPDITHNMRTILVDWLVEVAEEYKLHTETLYLAVNYIDRFLSYMSVVRAKLQLVGTASMFIASKYEEIFPPDVNEFVYITDDTYTKEQVLRMEMLILKVLDFDLSLPTTYTFITATSICNKLPEKTTYLAQYLSELALLEAEPTLEILPSVMGASAIAVARHTLGEEPWTSALAATTGYRLCELRPAVEFLEELHARAPAMAQQAVQEKYKGGKYLHVSSVKPREERISIAD